MSDRELTQVYSDDYFYLRETLYERNYCGRCYVFVDAWGFYTRAAREGGEVRKRISAKLYNEKLNEAKTLLAENREHILEGKALFTVRSSGRVMMRGDAS